MPDHDPHDNRPYDTAREDHAHSTGTDAGEDSIARGTTALRIGLSLVFILLARVAEMVLVAVIVFDLLFALIAQRRPSSDVRRFGNRVLSYLVEVVRYLTYEIDTPPFPFSELPPELDYVPKDGAAA
jgi:hypothetical protein